MDCCRGFVAPNTGDRLCGATVCVVSVPSLSPWWDTTISLLFEAHLPSSPSDHPEHLQQVVTGDITLPHNPGSDCLECTLITGGTRTNDCDDLDDKPSCTVSCLALLAVFVEESMVASILHQILSYLYLTS